METIRGFTTMQIILTEEEYNRLKEAAMPTVKIEAAVRERCAEAMAEWLKSALEIIKDEARLLEIRGPESLIHRLKTRAATIFHKEKGGGETMVMVYPTSK